MACAAWASEPYGARTSPCCETPWRQEQAGSEGDGTGRPCGMLAPPQLERHQREQLSRVIATSREVGPRQPLDRRGTEEPPLAQGHGREAVEQEVAERPAQP